MLRTTGITESTSRRNVLKATGAALGITALGGTASARGGNGRGRERGKRDSPHVRAHRGFWDVFPQNTVVAVAGSSRLGPERIGIDLVATSDGEIVVFRDPALKDFTDQTELVEEPTSEVVVQAAVLGSGETIPTLTETLDPARPSIMMTLEFKDSGPLTWEEFAERTLQIAREYPGEFYASSFDPDALPPFDPSIRASAWPRLSVATKNGTSRSPADSTPKR